MPGFLFRLCHMRIEQDVIGHAQSANYRKQHLIRRIDKSLFNILNMPKANPGLIGKLLLRKTAILSFRFDASPQLLQIAGWGIPSFWHSHLLSNQDEIFAIKLPEIFCFIAFSTLYCFILIAVTFFWWANHACLSPLLYNLLCQDCSIIFPPFSNKSPLCVCYVSIVGFSFAKSKD